MQDGWFGCSRAQERAVIDGWAEEAMGEMADSVAGRVSDVG